MDTKQMKEIARLLQEISAQEPQLRFMQILSNANVIEGYVDEKTGNYVVEDPYYKEDTSVVISLKNYLEQILRKA